MSPRPIFVGWYPKLILNGARRRLPILYGPLLGLAVLSGCASLPDPAAPSVPVVAVLLNHTWVEQDPRGFAWDVSKDELAAEQRFAGCVSEAAASKDFPLRAITGTQFRAQVFPDLDPRMAPRGIDALRSLIPDPKFHARVVAAGVRYLAVLGGETQTSEMKGGMMCAAGPGGGGCFGHLWWDHESRLSALVLDALAGREATKAGIDASGTSHFAVLAVFPLALPSGHEPKGCARFGQAVVEVLENMHGHGE